MNIHEKFFSKIGLNYLAFAITALLIQIILVNVIAGINGNLLDDFNFIVIISAICNYILPFPIFYYLMKKIETTKLEKSTLSIKTIILYIGITITLMWIGNIAGLIIIALLSGVLPGDIANPVQDLINSSDIWLNLLLVSILGPIFEEIFFRKMLIDRTIKYGARVSIILSAILFAFFHGNLNQFFYAFLIGGFFAFVYIKTGKIIYTILLHILVNLMGSVISLFVANSAQRILDGVGTTFDFGIIIIYVIIILSAILIGLIALSRYKKAKFNGSKTQINLENPIKTVILNYGMIGFIVFFIIQIITQIIR